MAPNINVNVNVSQGPNISIRLVESTQEDEANHTVGSVLALAGPYLDPNMGQPPRPLVSHLWVYVHHEHVRRWHDFNMQTLMGAFGNMLRIPAALDHRQIQFPIANVGSSKDTLVNYLNPLLQSPVAEGSQAVAAQLGLQPAEVSIRHNCFVGRFQPSLSFVWETDPTIALVHGATRRFRTWSSGDIGNDVDSLLPFRHIATFARHDKTRYTFVVTEVEVILARIFVTNLDQSMYGVEWQAIPWNACGQGTLTASLAIWCLVMMSLNGDHRGVVPQNDVRPLNGWWQVHDAQDHVVFVHHLSGRRLSQLPPGGQVIV